MRKGDGISECKAIKLALLRRRFARRRIFLRAVANRRMKCDFDGKDGLMQKEKKDTKL